MPVAQHGATPRGQQKDHHPSKDTSTSAANIRGISFLNDDSIIRLARPVSACGSGDEFRDPRRRSGLARRHLERGHEVRQCRRGQQKAQGAAWRGAIQREQVAQIVVGMRSPVTVPDRIGKNATIQAQISRATKVLFNIDQDQRCNRTTGVT